MRIPSGLAKPRYSILDSLAPIAVPHSLQATHMSLLNTGPLLYYLCSQSCCCLDFLLHGKTKPVSSLVWKGRYIEAAFVLGLQLCTLFSSNSNDMTAATRERHV